MGFGPNNGYCEICDGYNVVDENGECTYEDSHPKGEVAKIAKEVQAKVSTWTPEHAAEYVTESWRSAVESIIETGRRLIEAKRRVGHGQWLKTVELLPFGDETARRLMAIASDPGLSNPSTWRDLPPAWRTMFELSGLPEGELTKAIEAGRVTPDLTHAEARELVASIKRIEDALSGEDAMAAAVDEFYEGENPPLPIGIVAESADERPPMPSREGLEPHQVWVWLQDHWEVRGTGLLEGDDDIADAEIVPDTGEMRTESGKVLTDEDVQKLADEAEEGYDVAQILREEREAREAELAKRAGIILRKRGAEPVAGKPRTRVNKRLANKLKHAIETTTESMRQIATFDGFDETDWLPSMADRLQMMTDLAWVEDISRGIRATLKTLKSVPGDDE